MTSNLLPEYIPIKFIFKPESIQELFTIKSRRLLSGHMNMMQADISRFYELYMKYDSLGAEFCINASEALFIRNCMTRIRIDASWKTSDEVAKAMLIEKQASKGKN